MNYLRSHCASQASPTGSVCFVFNLHIRFQRNPDFLAGMVDGDMTMVSIENGKIYHLNPTGKRIWELLETPSSGMELCTRLQREFTVDPATCQGEVTVFLEKLIQGQAIQPLTE